MVEAIAPEDVRPIREIVYEHLKKAIGSGEIPGGERLNESDLAVRLNVSRTPIREAIRMLESDGLVESLPRRGVVVRAIDISEIIEIYMIRQALEVMVFKSAALRIAPREIEEARQHIRDSQTYLEEKKFEEYFHANELFTDTIVEAGRLPKTRQLIGTYRDQLRRYRKITLSDPVRRQTVVRQHLDILDALGKRDVERAGKLVFEHLEGALEVCKRHRGAEPRGTEPKSESTKAP
ncbi:MAG: GntR family transcriptional regulator [Synergistaceae bacterium]|jgi:DNA-binding GntR family transcriptional regulator|nr:GntR family transcriptional regulator [Synergistaceae bacterium]